MKKVKCPICGSDNIKLEAEITVRFQYNENGDIEVISDECDIIEEIEDEESYYCHCWDCDMLFDNENPDK